MTDYLKNLSTWKLRSPWIAGQMTVWSVVLMGSFITSLFLHYSSANISSTLPSVTFGINGCGLLLGGFIAGRKAGQKGWFHGGLQGVIYSCLLLTISFLAFDKGIRINPLVFSIFASSISAIGGIIGMNTKRT